MAVAQARPVACGRGCGGRLSALLLQNRPLLHAETLLLVYHHQPQRFENHIFLNQGVGTDDDVNSAFCQLFQQFCALGWCGAAREYRYGQLSLA